MYISPPISVLAILSVAFIGMAWLTPPARDEARITVTLPVSTYKHLVLWGQEHPAADGGVLSPGQVIEKFAVHWYKNKPASAN